MGGDHGTSVTLPACLAFLNNHSEARLLLVGLPEALASFSHPRVTAVFASEVVGMDDPLDDLERLVVKIVWPKFFLNNSKAFSLDVARKNFL